MVVRATYDFALEEGVVEVIEVHGDMVGGYQDSEYAEDQRSTKLVSQSILDALLFAVSPAVRWYFELAFKSQRIHATDFYIFVSEYVILNRPINQDRIKSDTANSLREILYGGEHKQGRKIFVIMYYGGVDLRDHMSSLHEHFQKTSHTSLRAYLLLRLPPQRHQGAQKLPHLPPALPFVPLFLGSTPAKLQPDHTITTFIEDLRKAHKRVESSKPENIHV